MAELPDDEMIPPPEESVDLFQALRLLPFMFGHLYLQMQCRNIAITDKFLEPMEGDLLAQKIDEERTPFQEAIILSAFSQMWVFAFFELMRTWKAFADEFLRFSRKLLRTDITSRSHVLEEKEAAIGTAARITIDGGMFHLVAARWVADDPEKARHILELAIENTKLLRRMLAEVRTSLAKHQIAGSGMLAPSPGYGTISPINGSISWRLLYDDNSEASVSCRNIADQCRAVGRDMASI
jgi:hypothetical protein